METKTYIVALRTGGVMEQPSFKYINHQYIEASSEREAEQIYNEKNNCSYYYGHVVGIGNTITVFDDINVHNSFS